VPLVEIIVPDVTHLYSLYEKKNGSGRLLDETFNSNMSRRVGAQKYFHVLKISSCKKCLEDSIMKRYMGVGHKGKIPYLAPNSIGDWVRTPIKKLQNASIIWKETTLVSPIWRFVLFLGLLLSK